MENNKRITNKLELGALLEVPIYKNHRRAKNWFARIKKNPMAPGGLDREFAPRAKGEYYYMLPNDWNVGDPIEFGADYYTIAGRKLANRFYGVIVEKTETYVIFEKAKSSSQAIQKAREYAQKGIKDSEPNNNWQEPLA